MPELPEVETIKNALEKTIGETLIEDVIINNYNLRQKIPYNLREKIKGASINNYQRRAKYIIIELNNDLSLIWHMGMSGKILICDNLPQQINKHDHVIIKTANGFMIYNDPRRFGLFTYAPTDEVFNLKLFQGIGPEPFEKTFNGKYLYERLKSQKLPVKAAIMDQKNVVGIGNIYASESLFLAGISPLRPANSLTLEECNVLVEMSRKVLKKAIAAGGSTLRDYEKPDGNLGYFQNQHCVYQKSGQKCPNCTCDIHKTGGIQKTIIAGRSTFYCKHKQK
ncbi:MAG: bifunctional DNA-formamidopyrimidine glycosylase/DNA-(apurinic or apyrimidinic site) lyase [Alphaproteobacteria bacterium]|nr:bifunctional DNA-formamidopyrimidine glycosylase/DNA-(apurinic or apyrimidinic site) lyase [Alphaproteobacteria bacterium]